jgi:hypothetical protein
MIQNNPNQKKFLSSEDIDVVIEIVKKYNLGPTDLLDDPELEKMLNKAKSPEEKVKIIENLPFNKIMDRLEEILRGEISLEDLPSLLKRDLNLSLFTAEKITREIKERIFSIAPEEKEEILEKPSPTKKDIYREPIE